MKPRWRSGIRQRTVWLQFHFAVATHQGSGFRIPALPKAEFEQLEMECRNWLATTRVGGGLCRGCWIAVYSRTLLTLVLEPRSWVKLEEMRHVEGTSLSNILLLLGRPTTGPLQCIDSNMGDWNRWGTTGYQIVKK